MTKYSFVNFDIDQDYVIAEITDGTRSWHVAADVDLGRNRAVFRRFDIHSDGGANKTGLRELRALAQWMKEQLNVQQLRIEGSTRTSGAGPGRLPGPLVF